jgi:hypothetical protein
MFGRSGRSRHMMRGVVARRRLSDFHPNRLISISKFALEVIFMNKSIMSTDDELASLLRVMRTEVITKTNVTEQNSGLKWTGFRWSSNQQNGYPMQTGAMSQAESYAAFWTKMRLSGAL